MRSIRVFAKSICDPYYESTIMVHDTHCTLLALFIQLTEQCSPSCISKSRRALANFFNEGVLPYSHTVSIIEKYTNTNIINC